MKLGSAPPIALAPSPADVADERPVLDPLLVVVPPALEGEVRTALDAALASMPARPSIAEKRGVARSLELVRHFEIEPGRDHSDADFPS